MQLSCIPLRPLRESIHAKARTAGKVVMNEIAKEILRNSSATCSDITLVLTEFMDVIRDHLLNGEEDTVDGFGRFHIRVTSNSVENPANF